MTVSSTINRAEYLGAGNDASFEYSWKAENQAHFLITVIDTAGDETTLDLTTHYTVDGIGEDDGGTVTLVNGGFAWQDSNGYLKTGYGIVLQANVPLKQEQPFRNQSSGFPVSYEEAFDRAARIDQQQQTEIDRSLRGPQGETTIGRLPRLADRLSKFLAFDAGGDPIASAGTVDGSVPVSTFIETLLDDTTATAALATLGLTVSTFIKTLLDDADAAAARTTLGVDYSFVNGQSVETAPALDDELLLGDTSGADLDKVTLARLLTLTRARNYVLNAEGRFFQRQVPATLTSRQDDQYGPDRWYVLTSGGAVNVQCARVAEITSGQPSSYAFQLRQADATARQFGQAQIIESDEAIALRGKQVTFSVWARTDGTEVPNFRMGIVEWTGTADSVTSDIVSSWAATPTLIANAAFINTPADLALTAAMQQFSVTVTLGSTFNNLVLFVWTPATEAQNDDIYFKQFQLVEFSEVLPFTLTRLRVSEDLAACQRFYEKSYNVDSAPGTVTDAGSVAFRASSTNVEIPVSIPVSKRTTPTVTVYSSSDGSAANLFDATGAANVAGSASNAGEKGFFAQKNTAGTDGNRYRFHWVADAEL